MGDWASFPRVDALKAERDALRVAYDHLMEASVGRWHDTYGGAVSIEAMELTEWLELPDDEYARWAEDPTHVVTPEATDAP